MTVRAGLKKLTVLEKLENETLRRGANGAFPQISILVAMLILTPTFRYIFLYRAVCITLILIFSFRWYVFRKYQSDPVRLSETNPWNLYLGISTSIFWMVLNLLVVHSFKMNSFPGLMHLFLTNGILAGVMYSLSPTPHLQRIFILILGVPVSMDILLYEGHSSYRYTGVALLVFVLYLITASRSHSHDMRAAFEFEERLTVQNARLQEIVDSIPGFMIIFSQQGEWLQWSRSTEKVFKNEKLRDEILAFIQSGSERKTKEIEIDTGEDKCFVITFEKLTSSEGVYIAIGLPVTELKEMETALESQKIKAEYSSRLAAIGEMAGGVAHEINNPLSVISITSEMLAVKLVKENVDESLWRKHTDKIFETSNRIAKIVKSLQLLTREDVEIARDDVDLNEIISEALDVSTEKMKRKGIELSYQSTGPVFVRGRRVEVGQLILNLINNSFDAIPGEGKIELNIQETPDNVFLYISDTGPGIPDEIADKIFQPFFSTKEVGEGTGLGLSIARSILKGNGGDIELLKAKGPTIFRLRFQK